MPCRDPQGSIDLPPDRPYDQSGILFDPSAAAPDAVSRRVAQPTQPGFRSHTGQTSRTGHLIRAALAYTERSNILFQYRSLPLNHIRIVVLHRGRSSDALELDIYQHDLYDNRLQYKALSYEWGRGPAMFPIILRDYTVDVRSDITNARDRLRFLVIRRLGTKAYIMGNLADALRHLRQASHDTTLWVDNLCINQRDDDEKEKQVARMAEIYDRAQHVNVWLGNATEGSDRGMDFADQILRFDELETPPASAGNQAASRWFDLMDVMSSRWFSRRWVIQEIALAKSASVHCGSKKVAWDEFAEAVELFARQREVVKAQTANIAKPLLAKGGLGYIEALGATNLIRMKNETVQRNGPRVEMKKTLESLVSSLTSFDASDPRTSSTACSALHGTGISARWSHTTATAFCRYIPSLFSIASSRQAAWTLFVVIGRRSTR